jgi:hypothetical protein
MPASSQKSRDENLITFSQYMYSDLAYKVYYILQQLTFDLELGYILCLDHETEPRAKDKKLKAILIVHKCKDVFWIRSKDGYFTKSEEIDYINSQLECFELTYYNYDSYLYKVDCIIRA